MHQEAFSRRNFLRLGASATAATAALAVLGPRVAFADTGTAPTFKLDPTGGGSSCRGGKGNGGCASCNACKHHAGNKVFKSKGAAGTLRAHKGCRCTVVAGPDVPQAVFDQAFLNGDVVDRRDPKIAQLLDTTTASGVEVPVLAATAPALLVAGGAVGYWFWKRKHVEPVGADADRGDWK
jgi:hypothetical protein